MSYSNAYFNNDEYDFPHPPLWLTWCGTSYEWGGQPKPENVGKGKIRHLDSLAKAKARVSRYAANDHMVRWSQRSGKQHPLTKGEFYEDWSIYEWTGFKYELRFEGRKGQRKSDHPLFKTPLKKKDAGVTHRVAADEDVQAAIASILKTGDTR